MDLRVIYLLFIFTILFSGCNKKDGESVYTQSEVQINAFVNHTETKSSQTLPLSKGINATFYAIKAGGSDIATMGDYVASSAGLMSGIDNYKMYLDPGIYSVYGLSENSDIIFPQLNQQTSPPLQNGTDYLYSENQTINVDKATTNLNVLFRHIMANLIFEVENGNNVTINHIDSILIQTPEKGAVINLTNPVVAQAKAFTNKLDKMIISGLRANYVMLPVNNKGSFIAYFYITINNQSSATPYSLYISLPSGGYSSEKSYLYTISVTETKLSIKAFTVSDWIINDNTDEPIIPQE